MHQITRFALPSIFPGQSRLLPVLTDPLVGEGVTMRPFAFLDVVTLLIFLTACPLHAQESRSKAETDPPNAEPALDDIQEEFDKRRDAERLLSFAGGAVVALVGITLPAYFLVAANKNSAADKFQDCMDKEASLGRNFD